MSFIQRPKCTSGFAFSFGEAGSGRMLPTKMRSAESFQDQVVFTLTGNGKMIKEVKYDVPYAANRSVALDEILQTKNWGTMNMTLLTPNSSVRYHITKPGAFVVRTSDASKFPVGEKIRLQSFETAKGMNDKSQTEATYVSKIKELNGTELFIIRVEKHEVLADNRDYTWIVLSDKTVHLPEHCTVIATVLGKKSTQPTQPTQQ